ncbi:MAG TPA: hypothetical protein VKA84_21610 [Gemmatimonadaceae bacterium]|nr:hypothetical protein [Gemmatimonadaceae bacterium]
MNRYALSGALAVAAACSGRDARPDSLATRPAETVAAAAAPPTPADSLCLTPPRGVVVTPDTLAGLPADAPISALVARCPGSTVDLFAHGGSQSPARVFRFGGATLVAGQTDYDYGDSLRMAESADAWEASGDSVRLPDGGLLPRTVGDLRERYGRGFVTADQRDDSEGVRAYLCRYPHLGFVLDYGERTPAMVGQWPLDARPVADSARIFSIEVWRGVGTPADSLCATPHSP